MTSTGVPQADDGGKADRPREDRGVVRPAALVTDQRGDVDASRAARPATASIRRDEHDRAFDMRGTGPTRFPEARRLPHSRADDVGDVPFALAQIRVIAAVEERRDLLQRLLQRRFGVDRDRSR